MTSDAFRELLERRAKRAELTLDPPVIEQLEAYFQLLVRWNAKVNLTGLPLEEPTDAAFDRLLIEPLVAARHIDSSCTPWLDVGSGGGSPAIPIKIVKPELQLTMVESKTRKAAFLREAIRTLGLSDTTVATVRFEELAARSDMRGMVALVTIRAVKPDAPLISAVGEVLRPGGQLCLFRESAKTEQFEGFAEGSAFALTAPPSTSAYLVSYRRR